MGDKDIFKIPDSSMNYSMRPGLETKANELDLSYKNDWTIIKKFATRPYAEGFIRKEKTYPTSKYFFRDLLLIIDPEDKDQMYYKIATKVYDYEAEKKEQNRRQVLLDFQEKVKKSRLCRFGPFTLYSLIKSTQVLKMCLFVHLRHRINSILACVSYRKIETLKKSGIQKLKCFNKPNRAIIKNKVVKSYGR